MYCVNGSFFSQGNNPILRPRLRIDVQFTERIDAFVYIFTFNWIYVIKQITDTSTIDETKIQFNPMGMVLRDELINLQPENQWTDEEFIELAVDESWNRDEIFEEGYIALKRLFYRIIVPKDHWEDCTYEKFLRLTIQKYAEINNCE